MVNGNSKLSAFIIKIAIKILAIAEYSCALDDHLAGSSDKQAAERQYDQMRSLFSHHADRHSSVYVLLESLPNATSSRSFKTFVSQIFYAGSTEARDNRAQSHAGGFQVGFYSKTYYNLHNALCFKSPNKIKKLREIWAAGGAVYMLELGGLAREEAKIAESAVIDAFGRRYFHRYDALSVSYCRRSQSY